MFYASISRVIHADINRMSTPSPASCSWKEFLSRMPFFQISLLGVIIRGALLVYGEWQDQRMTVKYTDVDYYVFSDAARYLSNGQSPFERATFRYTPLLAYLLLPNQWIHPTWGKVLFSAADLIAAWFIYVILCRKRSTTESAKIVALFWLLNPMTFTVSTRGNAESIICSLVISSLYLLTGQTRDSLIVGSMLFGLAVHFKLFPAIFALPICIHLLYDPSNGTLHQKRSSVSSPKVSKIPRLQLKSSPERALPVDLLLKEESEVNPFIAPSKQEADGLLSKILRILLFGAVSFGTFALFSGAMYLSFGEKYFYESFLYHLIRKDHRHNFSPYFLPFYLESIIPLPKWSGLAAFIPQMILLGLVGLKYGRRDIYLACFLQTLIFVTFNKVCTSQYFLWYLCLLPLSLGTLKKVSQKSWILIAVAWFGAQVRM